MRFQQSLRFRCMFFRLVVSWSHPPLRRSILLDISTSPFVYLFVHLTHIFWRSPVYDGTFKRRKWRRNKLRSLLRNTSETIDLGIRVTAALLETLPFIGLIFLVSNRVGAAMWAHGMEISKTGIRSIANSDVDFEKRQHWFAEKKWKSSWFPGFCAQILFTLLSCMIDADPRALLFACSFQLWLWINLPPVH